MDNSNTEHTTPLPVSGIFSGPPEENPSLAVKINARGNTLRLTDIVEQINKREGGQTENFAIMAIGGKTAFVAMMPDELARYDLSQRVELLDVDGDKVASVSARLVIGLWPREDLIVTLCEDICDQVAYWQRTAYASGLDAGRKRAFENLGDAFGLTKVVAAIETMTEELRTARHEIALEIRARS